MRTLTVLLGDNQDFTAAEVCIVKHGGTRVEDSSVVMNREALEAEIPAMEWEATRVELQYLKYDLV